MYPACYLLGSVRSSIRRLTPSRRTPPYQRRILADKRWVGGRTKIAARTLKRASADFEHVVAWVGSVDMGLQESVGPRIDPPVVGPLGSRVASISELRCLLPHVGPLNIPALVIDCIHDDSRGVP